MMNQWKSKKEKKMHDLKKNVLTNLVFHTIVLTDLAYRTFLVISIY